MTLLLIVPDIVELLLLLMVMADENAPVKGSRAVPLFEMLKFTVAVPPGLRVSPAQLRPRHCSLIVLKHMV
jgi:hypothetical protein